MPTIDLTDEQAEELRDVLQREIDHLSAIAALPDASGESIQDAHVRSVLSDILHILEIA
jgi:hypothetical protein